MTKIYQHVQFGPDAYRGRIERDGKVYRHRTGPDEYIGWIHYGKGEVFRHVPLAPDAYLGKIAPDRKIYRHVQFGPDEYLGQVTEDGKLFRHVEMAPDAYIGRLEAMRHPADGAAAMLLFFS
ncbi:MAG: hypothetical protein JXB47_04635 [Anaerolineae bacterium]|nr:hypothetical protein [Anaerolineae bacterium]